MGHAPFGEWAIEPVDPGVFFDAVCAGFGSEAEDGSHPKTDIDLVLAIRCSAGLDDETFSRVAPRVLAWVGAMRDPRFQRWQRPCDDPAKELIYEATLRAAATTPLWPERNGFDLDAYFAAVEAEAAKDET